MSAAVAFTGHDVGTEYLHSIITKNMVVDTEG